MILIEMEAGQNMPVFCHVVINLAANKDWQNLLLEQLLEW